MNIHLAFHLWKGNLDRCHCQVAWVVKSRVFSVDIVGNASLNYTFFENILLGWFLDLLLDHVRAFLRYPYVAQWLEKGMNSKKQ